VHEIYLKLMCYKQPTDNYKFISNLKEAYISMGQ